MPEALGRAPYNCIQARLVQALPLVTHHGDSLDLLSHQALGHTECSFGSFSERPIELRSLAQSCPVFGQLTVE